MKKDMFKKLLESVKQGGSIMRGTMKPLRSFEFPESEVRKIREHYGLSQDKFAAHEYTMRTYYCILLCVPLK